MSAPEFSHRVLLEKLSREPHRHSLAADAEARAGLAKRFGLLALDRLEAELDVRRTALGAALDGRLSADLVQPCVVSGEPVPARIDEPVELRFEPIDPEADEIELDAAALDVLPVEGGAIDLGEAVAQALAVALDPYPRAAPEQLAAVRPLLTSEEAAAEALIRARAAASPFAALKRDD